ncbi:MAG TPA: TlpA disulfide reductase family protein [Gaiellaceae bacterium]|nr:TlpA disulfide reductase family protein [Gaiellaceae bacterium]
MVVASDRTRLPRPLAIGIVAAILAATAVAFVWPSLPFNASAPTLSGPTRVNVITQQLGGTAAGIGDAAPDFSWVTSDGRAVRLSSLRGHPVVINFWATWCDPCRAEMPLLDRAAAADPRTRFLAVDLGEDGPTIRAFFTKLGIQKLEPLLDADLATARRYGLANVPSTFFIGADGAIRQVHVGQMDQDTLKRELSAIQ